MKWLRHKSLAFQMSIVLAFATVSFPASAQESMSTFCGKCRAEKFATCGGFLEAASVDPSGRLWVADIPGDRILNVTEDGQCVLKGKTGGMPLGMKFSKDGRLFMTDGKLGLISFDLSTSKVTVLASNYDGASFHTNDLAMDEVGGIYFTDQKGGVLNPIGRVFYMDPDYKTLHLVTDKLASPNGIAISRDGQSILIGEFAALRVLILPAVGAKNAASQRNAVYAYTRGGMGPDGIMVDSMGHLLTANFETGEVLVFAADGRPMGAIQIPDEQSKRVTNMVIRGHYLYVTAGASVWRVALNN